MRIKVFTAKVILIEDPENVEARQSEVDSSEHASPLHFDGVQEEEEGVDHVVAAPAHVQLLLPQLHHVVAGTLGHLDHSQAAPVRLPPQLVTKLDKVAAREGAEVLARLPGGGEQPGVEVGGQAVHHQLTVRGKSVSPALPARGPPVPGHGPGGGQLLQPLHQVHLVTGHLQVGDQGGEGRKVRTNLNNYYH